jgi:hypothetical protein
MDADVRIKNEVAEIQRREVTEIQRIVEERRKKVDFWNRSRARGTVPVSSQRGLRG